MAQLVDMDIQFLPGVGPKRAELLRKELNINTVGDLLRFWPFRYIDRCSFVMIADARADIAYIQIRAKVLSVELFSGNSLSSIDASDASKLKFNTIKRMKVMIGDESGQMETTYFKGIKWVWEKLKVGSEFIFFGKPSTFNNRVTMVHPEIDPVPADNASAPNGNGLVGVYSSTEKLRNSSISNKVMNNLMQAALNCGLKYVKERGERWGVFIISSHFSAPSSLLNAPSHAKVTSFSSLFFKKSSFFFSRGLLLATFWIRMAGMPHIRLLLSTTFYCLPMSNIPTCSFLLLQNIDSAPRPTDNPNIPTDDRFLRQSPA